MSDPRTNHDRLDAEALVAYHRGTLDDDARSAVQVRLAADPEAVQLLLDLAAGPDLASAPGDASPSDTVLDDADVAMAWDRFQAVLAPDEDRAGTHTVLPFARPAAPTRERRGRRQRFLALAATLAMAVLGLAAATSWLEIGSGDDPPGLLATDASPTDEPDQATTTLIAGFGDQASTNGWVTVGGRDQAGETALFAESFETASLPVRETAPRHDARGEIFGSSFREHDELDGWSSVVGAN